MTQHSAVVETQGTLSQIMHTDLRKKNVTGLLLIAESNPGCTGNHLYYLAW